MTFKKATDTSFVCTLTPFPPLHSVQVQNQIDPKTQQLLNLIQQMSRLLIRISAISLSLLRPSWYL